MMKKTRSYELLVDVLNSSRSEESSTDTIVKNLTNYNVFAYSTTG